MIFLYFLMAIFFMILGHVLKTLRWKQLIKVYEIPANLELLNTLSIGYLVNSIFPYRIGDLVRIYLMGRRLKNGYSLATATIAIDSCIDIIVVGIVFGIFSYINKNSVQFLSMSHLYLVIAIFMIIICILSLRYKQLVKKIIAKIASVFNEKIELSILYISWAIIYSLKDMIKKFSIYKILLLTLGMWIMYFISYLMFSEYITFTIQNIDISQIFFILFSTNIASGIFGKSILLNSKMLLIFILYMIIPLIIILISGKICKITHISKKNTCEYRNILPHLNSNDRLNFLETYFQCENKEYLNVYLNINSDVNIIQDYSAGSNATTMLCIANEKTFYRKYAFGEDSEKLFEQICWIKTHEKIIPLTSIMRYEKKENYCFYDMPYLTNAISLFQYVHCVPIENGWNIIRNVFDSLNSSLYQYNQRNADISTIKKYISQKVTKNIEKIMSSRILKNIMKYENVIINGVSYKNLSYYLKFLSEDYLLKIFLNDKYSDIHGDLTIENIICLKTDNNIDDFYIIDPNTGNIHESPNLDYGKMLQSIHGGYEFLMSTSKVTIIDNCIDYLSTRSSIYNELYENFKNYMLESFSYEKIRSIYFHEIIHWIRLMPYKLEKDKDRVGLFYSQLLIILKEIIDMYEGDKNEM